jgi:uncharacterized protein YciI
MAESREYFFLKLIPCRPTFAYDMTDDERAVMKQHAAYWRYRMDKGQVVVFGPVMDPKGTFGVGIVVAEDEEAVREFIASDPASQINQYQFYRMQAVLPDSAIVFQ